MADVNITVMIDGKPAFVHGAIASPDVCTCVLAGLQAGVDHFKSLQATVSAAVKRPPQTQAETQNSTKGPSL